MSQATGQLRGRSFLLGSDHAGRELKDQIKQYLANQGSAVEDLSPEGDQTDYPLVGEAVGRAVAKQAGSYGVIVCGTGIGISIAANKVPGVRAALLYSEAAARYARQHNDANVLAFGGRTMDFPHARRCLEAFFAEEFAGGRHGRRNEQIRAVEERGCPGRDWPPSCCAGTGEAGGR